MSSLTIFFAGPYGTCVFVIRARTVDGKLVSSGKFLELVETNGLDHIGL